MNSRMDSGEGWDMHVGCYGPVDISGGDLISSMNP